MSKDMDGPVKRGVLTKHWSDWVDYRAVLLDYVSRQEIIKVPRGTGIEASLPGLAPRQGERVDF